MTNNELRVAAHTLHPTVCSRRNHTVAEIVDKGIALQEKCGTRHAAEYLKTKMVHIDVAARVLLSTSQRRHHFG